MYWTAGQRSKLDHATLPAVPLVWKLRPAVWQTMYLYVNWPNAGPWSPADLGPSPSGDCVYVASAGQHRGGTAGLSAGTWGTGPCETRLCVICELTINYEQAD